MKKLSELTNEELLLVYVEIGVRYKGTPEERLGETIQLVRQEIQKRHEALGEIDFKN